MFMNRLRSLQVDRMIDINDAIELITFGREAVKTYESYKVPAPGFLTDAVATLDAEINRRRKDMLLAREKELTSRLSTLKTREEKRSETEAELALLRETLNAS